MKVKREKNAHYDPAPIRLLAEYDHIEFPSLDAGRRAWQKVFAAMQHNLQVTIRFANAQMQVLGKNTELYETVVQARSEAINLARTVRAAQKPHNHDAFLRTVDALKGQYANLIGHVRHYFYADTSHQGLYEFVEKTM